MLEKDELHSNNLCHIINNSTYYVVSTMNMSQRNMMTHEYIVKDPKTFDVFVWL